MSTETLELLDRVMTGASLTASDVNDLLVNQIREDQHLDYKHGDELKKKKPCRVIREYLTAFANSDGGVLLVGIDEGTWSVTGATAPGGAPLDEWAKSCVLDLSAYFSPLPKFDVISHPGGNVLVAAVMRSSSLVPDVQGRRLIWHLRIHDSTVTVPEYLLADLVLGRREHPNLVITDSHFIKVDTIEQQTKGKFSGDYMLRLQPHFRIENLSFSWVNDVRMGILSYNYNRLGRPEPNRYLMSHIEDVGVDRESFTCHHSLGHYEIQKSNQQQGPFALIRFQLPLADPFTIPLRRYSDWFTPYLWLAAVYLATRDSPPIWYQIQLQINMELLTLVDQEGRDRLNERKDDFYLIQRITGDLPKVGWVQLD